MQQIAPASRTDCAVLPTYVLPQSELSMGASFGNASIWVNTKGTGAIERIFLASLGESLFGAVAIRYGIAANVVRAPWSHRSAIASRHFAPLQDDPLGVFEIHPAFQQRRGTIAGSVEISETVFVPLTPADDGAEPSVAHILIRLKNAGRSPQQLRLLANARLRGSLEPDVHAHYDESLHALVATGTKNAGAVRIFGASVAPDAYGTTLDFGSVCDPSHMHALDNETTEHGDVLGSLQIDVSLAPGEERDIAFTAGAYGGGAVAAVAAHGVLLPASEALEVTLAHLRDIMQISQVLTPDPDINAGALWSKVNMRRVMSDYPQGPAFTNEPGVSSNIVGRDAAWFVYGNDHFLPDFSRSLLDKLADVQYPGGKIPEYYNAIDGRAEDDGLNINDDTPLFILAVNHHARTTGDLAWLERIYPSIRKAARYIISQTDDRDLVFCDARDPRGNVWAIASWRNVIPGYTINGAVTEINAECIAALRAAAHLAQNIGRPAEESDEFFGWSDRVRSAMNRHLRNPENGLYFLNIDADGVAHTDVTGDQIFPVMFRACDDDTGFRIIRRLNAPDFWTPAGLRTVSRNDSLYDPAANIGLLGGVWPGLTWWYAFAAARYHPEFMVQALRASFRHYAANPKNNNTVPGQFGEYFDGESLVNRGMRLSPWEPPRYLWAAIEGVCGLMVTVGAPRVAPLVPSNWKWVALRRLPYHSGEISYFAVREGTGFRIYATAAVESRHATERFDEDVTPLVSVFSRRAAVVALRRADSLVILVANTSGHAASIPIDISALVEAGRIYDLRLFDSELDAWENEPGASGADLATVALGVEPEGYRLLELRACDRLPAEALETNDGGELQAV